MEVVAFTIEINGKDKKAMSSLLSIVSATHRHAGQLRGSIGLIGRLKRTSIECLLGYRLWNLTWINAGA